MNRFTLGKLRNELEYYTTERRCSDYPIMIEVDGKDFYFDIVEGHNKVRLVVTDPISLS
jgi:hypothetical protein